MPPQKFKNNFERSLDALAQSSYSDRGSFNTASPLQDKSLFRGLVDAPTPPAQESVGATHLYLDNASGKSTLEDILNAHINDAMKAGNKTAAVYFEAELQKLRAGELP